MKKSTVRIKSGFMKCQNRNFVFALQNPPTKVFPRVSKLPAGLLTSTGTFTVFVEDNAFQRTGDVSYPIQFLHSNGYFPTISLKLNKKIITLKGQ